MASVVRSTALRAGGACVRCRKGKTKCVYENGRAPCKNCAKGMHECYLPSESMAHGGHGVSPARMQHRIRESLPSERVVSSSAVDRQVPAGPSSSVSRHASAAHEKLTPELMTECERVISKTLPACVAFHKPTFLVALKNASMEPTMVNALLTTAARHSPAMIRRYGGHGSSSTAAEHFASKTINLVMQNLDTPSLADIQSVCLLILHEWGCRNAVRAYTYLGLAARMAQMYRLVHHHNSTNEPDQFQMEESFRRTLWLIYILDCFLTSSPGRHPALTHLDVQDVSLPCLDMNYNFTSPVHVRTLSGAPPAGLKDPSAQLSEVGEFGHIVLATKAWRQVVEMMTTTTLATFSDERCVQLEQDIEVLRQSLPMHFADKPNNINLHITMGSGYTYAFIHCLLNCGTIFVNRRRMLQVVTDENFSIDLWRGSSHTHVQTVDKIFAASHSIIHSLLALETGADKDSILCFPLFMLFAAFTAGSTVAYLTLKGLAPANSSESAFNIVRDSVRMCQDGAESWPLVIPWQRHLSVMSKVLRDVKSAPRDKAREDSKKRALSPSVKDDNVSQTDTNPDAMDYEQPDVSAAGPQAVPTTEGRASEPPVPRKTGITTINGGPVAVPTPADSPPPPVSVVAKVDSPSPASPGSALGGVQSSSTGPDVPDVDMTALELCAAFERQLLELDDLAAFMGGGVGSAPS
ncbi:hypothetical protein QC762_302470 [Podospora pseudocomata]|uniref:Zn(2)-C6 fungal-type domain-containing protein n=1 Tax=Podospora pseudocomata TaxID=2093779 RepID=A0ABR0GI99_9PEZI|nr:hypothetical protein QC762_302470 [Podospora pseudocomata]